MMKAKSKRERTAKTNDSIETISLREPLAMLLAKDRLNARYNGEYVAYVDHCRGMTVQRHVVAHSKDVKVVSNSVKKLAPADQKRLVIHFACQGETDVIEVHWDLPWHGANFPPADVSY